MSTGRSAALLLIRGTWFSDAYHALLPKWPWAMLPLLAFGPAMIFAAFRTGVFLLVETSRSTRGSTSRSARICCARDGVVISR